MSLFSLFPLLMLSLFLGGCSEPSQSKEEDSVSEQIDHLVSSIKEGEELSHEDRNKIYDLATYLNQKYKGEMASDEILEVVSED